MIRCDSGRFTSSRRSLAIDTRTLCALFLFVSTAFADVITVTEPGGDGDFTSLQQALLAAQDGDTVVVRGTGTVVFNEVAAIAGRSVSLIAEEGVTARLEFLQIRNVPADRVVVVRGVELRGPLIGALPTPLEIRDCVGHVRLEEVTSRGKSGVPFGLTSGFDGSPAALVLDSDDVVFQRCTFTAGGGGTLENEDIHFAPTNGAPALVAERSALLFSESSLIGGAGGDIEDTTVDEGGAGGPGLSVFDSELRVFGTTIHGGRGGHGDCDFFIDLCGGGGLGGDGLVSMGAGRVVVRDAEVLGGPGGGAGGDGGTNGSPGERVTLDAGVTLTSYASAMPLFSSTRLVDTPGPVTFTVTADEPAVFALWVALDPALLDLPALEGVLSSVTPIVEAVVVGTAPVAGPTPLTFEAPVLPAGTSALTLFTQMIVIGREASSLSSGSTLTLISAPL